MTTNNLNVASFGKNDAHIVNFRVYRCFYDQKFAVIKVVITAVNGKLSSCRGDPAMNHNLKNMPITIAFERRSQILG